MNRLGIWEGNTKKVHQQDAKGVLLAARAAARPRDRWGQGITSPQKPSAVLPRAVMPVHGTGRVRRLLLVGVPAAASELPAGAFGDLELQAAVDAWVADPAAAEATHGSISGWDTSRVDSMAFLFQEKSAFNEAIGGWDTSKMTNMEWFNPPNLSKSLTN